MKKICYPLTVKSENGVKDSQNLVKKKSLQIGLEEKILTCFEKDSYIILDYGVELRGGIRILSYAANDVSVRIRFGESLTECSSEVGDEKNATNDHSLRDFSVRLQNYSDMSFGGSGFRFIRLDFSDAVSIKSIVAETEILNKKPLYVFNGRDEEIRQIYNVAKRTIDLCAAGDYLWDGIKRDRLVWIGDMHPEMLALTTLYGRMGIIERSLTFVKNSTPMPLWMNRIPTYSMWFIIIVADYLKITGAVDFSKKQVKYIQDVIRLMLKNVSEDGELHYSDNFLDWQTRFTEDEVEGVRAVSIIAAKKAKEFLLFFNEDTKDVDMLLDRLLRKEITVKQSKAVLGLKYFATGLTEKDKQKLVEGGANGMSAFMSYYILTAVASFDKGKAECMLKEYFGGMLSKGATTFWEDFNMSWMDNSCRIDELPNNGEKDIHGDFGAFCYKGFRHSLCHGWSSGIIKFIKDYSS